MVAVSRIRTILSITSIGTLLTILTTSTSVRVHLFRLFSPTIHPFHALALLLTIILNAKSLPFVWHVRLFCGMGYQLYLQPTPLPRDALFRPIVTTSIYTPITECDYNGHKSNSTYFADLDISRAQLISCLLRKGIRATNMPRASNPETEWNSIPANGDEQGAEAAKGNFMIALGAVCCNFKREIKPYEKFQIWTRVLSWDKKWLYLVSHMVKAGTTKPRGWALQPWKVFRSRNAAAKKSWGSKSQANGGPINPEETAEWRHAIFASSIAKYVVKRGRLTIAPEEVLRNSGLLPPCPGNGEVNTQINAVELSHWTWGTVQAERLRGLQLAEKFGALDGLQDEFPIAPLMLESEGRINVLGEFKDLTW